MSGPSTRSHRSSVRGAETTLTELSQLLKEKKKVVMITGAGLSAASGIPTFRGGSDSVWRVTAAAQGRRSVFLRDPLRWYNEFFLKHFPMSFTRKTPNPGHEAIAVLASAYPELRVITQNIDGLHRETVNAWPDPERIIEVHGRLGLFKCVSEEGAEGENDCPYSFDKEILPSDFPESVRAALEDNAHVTAVANGLGCGLNEIPRCPHCSEASPPMSLLFDEDYDSHSFYDFERAEEWFTEADAIVFVGTSFAVTLTSLAIREAKRRRIPVFDFNLCVSLKASPALDAKTVLGTAEATLPTLARMAGASTVSGGPSTTSPLPLPSAAAAAPTASAVAAVSAASAAAVGNNSSVSADETLSADWASTASALSEGTEWNDAGEVGEFTANLDVAGGGNRADDGSGHDISPLGRRVRDESPDFRSGSSDEVQGGLEQRGAAKVAKGSRSIPKEPDDAIGGYRAAPAATERGVWGGGAKFLLDPVLETPLPKSQVRVDVSESYSRKPHPDPEVEANVESLWQEQLAKNPLLFNGLKFRLAGFSTEGALNAGAAASLATITPTATLTNSADMAGSTTDSSEGGDIPAAVPTPSVRIQATQPPRSRSPTSTPTRKLSLRLGLTDYRTFRGTNWSPAAAKLAADGARDFPWLEGAYLSQKLGVGAIVETVDGFLLSLRRSSGVGEGQGMMDAPGGHPEPTNLGLTDRVLKSLSGKQQSSRRKVGQHAVEELFDSAVQEVVDETNVPRTALGEVLLSGVVRQGNSFGAPSAAFIIPCSLESTEVLALYARGAKEAFESTELQPIPVTEVLAEGSGAWFETRGLQATPSFEGALELWRALRTRGCA